MPFLALLSDRSPHVAVPALPEVAPDLKVEPLSAASLEHVLELECGLLRFLHVLGGSRTPRSREHHESRHLRQ